MTNNAIALRLLQSARELDPRTNLYRARAYRQAALTIQRMDVEISHLLRSGGRGAVARWPGIGNHLAFTIETLVETGKVVPWAERKGFLTGIGKVA